jgi:hypothetical protein
MEEQQQGGPPNDAQEFISFARERAVAKLKARQKGQASPDIDHLVRTTRALITTNKEIWARCEPSIVCTTSTAPDHHGSGGRKTTMEFKRITFETVEVQTNVGWTSFTVTGISDISTKSFGKPAPFPHDLGRIFVLQVPSPDGIIPDYDSFLELVLLLHEDVLALGPFPWQVPEALGVHPSFLRGD